MLRKVIVPFRADGIGELVILSEELESLIKNAGGVRQSVKDEFVRWLRGNPAAQIFDMVQHGHGGEARVGVGDGLSGKEGWKREDVDALVRAGFLTAMNDGPARKGEGLYARPSERHSLVSLETVAKAAAGSVAAVGGTGVVHGVGGTGRRGGLADHGPEQFRLAIPGAGVYLKLVAGALEYLRELLGRTQYRQMAESDLREKWDGGVAGDSEAVAAKKARGEFVGVLPGKTRKWKELHGMAFDWILREAMGAGVVEIFETRSVGRGVRLVS